MSIYLTKLIIDAVAAGFNNTDKTAAFHQVLFLVTIMGAVTLITSLCNSLTELVTTAHSMRVTDYMQGIVQSKSIQASLEYYENPQYYDTLQRAQQEAPYRPPQILNRLAQVGQSSISLVGMVALLLSLHWGIIGVVFVAALPAMLVWQKIALARAFLRDSQLIVLDEPTSAMDPKAEYEVFEGFRQLIKNQSAILISHRLSTVKMADRIYVMSGGSIVESGTHEELMKLSGSYAFLFETQAQQYR